MQGLQHLPRHTLPRGQPKRGNAREVWRETIAVAPSSCRARDGERVGNQYCGAGCRGVRQTPLRSWEEPMMAASAGHGRPRLSSAGPNNIVTARFAPRRPRLHPAAPAAPRSAPSARQAAAPPPRAPPAPATQARARTLQQRRYPAAAQGSAPLRGASLRAASPPLAPLNVHRKSFVSSSEVEEVCDSERGARQCALTVALKRNESACAIAFAAPPARIEANCVELFRSGVPYARHGSGHERQWQSGGAVRGKGGQRRGKRKKEAP